MLKNSLYSIGKTTKIMEVEYPQLQGNTHMHRESKNTRYLLESSDDYLRTLKAYME